MPPYATTCPCPYHNRYSKVSTWIQGLNGYQRRCAYLTRLAEQYFDQQGRLWSTCRNLDWDRTDWGGMQRRSENGNATGEDSWLSGWLLFLVGDKPPLCGLQEVG